MTGGEYLKLLEKSQKQAHELLFNEYYSYVRAIAFNRLRSVGSTEDVEECISDIFARIFFTFGEKYSNGDMKAFIRAVAKRISIEHYRRLVRYSGKSFSIDEGTGFEVRSDEDLVSDSEKTELSHILMESINSLGEPDSTIVIQKYYYGKKSHQIGELLSMKPSSVRMRCKRAVEKLKGILASKGVKEEVI